MQARRRAVAAVAIGVLGILLSVVAPALACTPFAYFTASTSYAEAGSVISVRGSYFHEKQGPIEISWWDTPVSGGAMLATTKGPTFSLAVTVPPAAPGTYYLVAQQLRADGEGLYASRTIPFTVAGAISTKGYRTVAADGGLFAFGEASYHGSTGGTRLDERIVGMAATPSSQGYWLVAADGGIFAFGDAGFFGSTGGTSLQAPIVGMAATISGQGYWLVAGDGGIFAFGDAVFLGSTGGRPLARPIVGMAPSGFGDGYWLVAADGGVFTFGDAGFFGSVGGMRLAQPVVDMAPSAAGKGYWLAAADGGVFAFGDARFLGSTGGVPLAQPIVGLDATAPPPFGDVHSTPRPYTGPGYG